MIKFFGENIAGPLAPGSDADHRDGPNQIRGAYVLYIGAGAVAAGGILQPDSVAADHLARLARGLRDLGLSRGDAQRTGALRTERDLSMKFVAVGIILLLAVITFAPRRWR
jgi:uncharacterized oligopeptide transporter (OPT) family protein